MRVCVYVCSMIHFVVVETHFTFIFTTTPHSHIHKSANITLLSRARFCLIRESVELDRKITSFRISSQRIARKRERERESRRGFPPRSSRGYFPLDASSSVVSRDFCALFFIILAPAAGDWQFQAFRHARERARDRNARRNARGERDLPVSSKRFETQYILLLYVPARFVITRLTANRVTSRNRARVRA